MNSSSTKQYQPARSIVVKSVCLANHQRQPKDSVQTCPDYLPLSVSFKDLFALETIRRANHLAIRNHMESLNNKARRHQSNTLQESTFKNLYPCVFQTVKIWWSKILCLERQAASISFISPCSTLSTPIQCPRCAGQLELFAPLAQLMKQGS